jgi:uncharacterized membrane protein
MSKLFREYKEALMVRDIKLLKVILQDMFAEPVSDEDVTEYLRLQRDVKVDDFLHYIEKHLGVRFVYAMRHCK